MILGEMLYVEVSDIRGVNPQFKLICISTGGPATTVTWTRDSTTVTEGTETVLNDPVTAQYTHTLTVTGRLPGLYTCTVANNKPSRDSTSRNVTITGMLPIIYLYKLTIYSHFRSPCFTICHAYFNNNMSVLYSSFNTHT